MFVKSESLFYVPLLHQGETYGIHQAKILIRKTFQYRFCFPFQQCIGINPGKPRRTANSLQKLHGCSMLNPAAHKVVRFGDDQIGRAEPQILFKHHLVDGSRFFMMTIIAINERKPGTCINKNLIHHA